MARPAGRPALNVETRLVDDDGEDVGPGEIGEIVHRSPQATLGYWNDEAKTAEAFRGGWFHSGDLGRLDADGYLFIVDRKKDLVKTGGENVASSEVEGTIYLMSEVSEVAVFGVAHPRWIEAVVAAVVPRAVRLTDPGGRHRPLPIEAGRLQDPEARRHRRQPAEKPERQAAQAGSA